MSSSPRPRPYVRVIRRLRAPSHPHKSHFITLPPSATVHRQHHHSARGADLRHDTNPLTIEPLPSDDVLGLPRRVIALALHHLAVEDRCLDIEPGELVSIHLFVGMNRQEVVASANMITEPS
jgi:hypothetical protein